MTISEGYADRPYHLSSLDLLELAGQGLWRKLTKFCDEIANFDWFFLMEARSFDGLHKN